MKKLLGLFFLLSSGLVWAGSLWVGPKEATLKADKSRKADNVATLSPGSELTQLAYKKRWYQVRTADGQEGWIYRGKISKTPPEALDLEFMMPVNNDVIKLASVTASRSARGKKQKKSEQVDYDKLLNKIIALKITEKRLMKFLKKGALGEYGE